MTRQTRRERRRVELDERRQQRRARRAPNRRSLLLPASIGALVVGLIAVVGFALANAPRAPVELAEPAPTSPYQLAEGRALGEAGAPVTIEIWSDFQCPACKTLVDTVEPRLAEDYLATGQLRVEYRDYAFLGQESVDAAIGARCAERQDRFWQYHDYLFANQRGENRGQFSRERLDAIAETIGLDMAAFRSCRDEPEHRQELAAERDAGAQLGINSTPSLVLAGRLFAGVPQYSELAAAIDAELAGAGPGRSP